LLLPLSFFFPVLIFVIFDIIFDAPVPLLCLPPLSPLMHVHVYASCMCMCMRVSGVI
jgi:hypothetical protein